MPRSSTALFLALAAAPLETRVGAQVGADYRVETYTTERGLPSQAVTSVAQTGDGFVWAAAGGILARFDGHEFVSYTARAHPALTRRVNSVHAGMGDTLWILDEGNAVLAAVGGKVVQVVPPSQRQIVTIAQDGSGTLYGAGVSILWRLGRGADPWRQVAPRISLQAAAEHPMVRDGNGRLWIVDSLNVLRQIEGSASPGRPTNSQRGAITSATTGEVFVVHARGALLDVVGMNGEVVATYPDAPYSSPRLIDRDGRLWVMRVEGYEVYEHGRAQPTARIPVRTPDVDPRMIEDKSGCLWSAELALRKLCRVPFKTVSARFPSGYFARGPGGTPLVWELAGVRIVAISPDGSAPRPLAGEHRLIDGAILYVDRRGASWVGLAAWSDSAKARSLGETVHVIPNPGVYAFAESPRRGEIWYAAGEHIYRAEATTSRRVVVRDSVAAGGTVVGLASASDGSAWAAIKGPDMAGRLLHIQGSRVTAYSTGDGLPTSALRAVLADDDGTVWLGTYGGGLVRLRSGRFRAVTEADGLSDDVVTSLLEDGLGNLWMGGNRSVHRVSRRELDDFFEGRTRHVSGVAYGRADGLTEPETMGTSGLRDDAGRLWFPTIAGAAVVDPAMAIALDHTAPRVHVLGLRSDRDTVSDATAPVRLTRGARRLTVKYSATSSRNDDAVRFEYRMDGVDRDWVNAGSVREATYNSVGAGTHVFRVRAFNSGGVPAERDATLQVTVPPFFYETPPFFVLLLLGAVALAWGAVTYRERHLRQRAAVLTKAVEDRTTELESAMETLTSQADQLRTLDEAKSRFFANVSHEFRTPLSLIIGPVEDLRDGRSGEMTSGARRRLDAVLVNARRLLQLVEQLLDIARLESGTLQLSADVRDLVPLLRRLADSFASLAERRGIAFRLSCPVGAGLRVHYDPDQMEKVISNLVGNALKFTPAGGEVELRVSADDGWVVIEVQDNGPGIASENHARVFDRFFQVDDSSRRAHEGTGIGLALVRDLVVLHGGTVSLKSELGAGSIFTVRLPLASADLRMSPERPIPAVERPAFVPEVDTLDHRSRKIASADVTTVLVVEDNAELLEFLREHLAERFRVLVAENGVRGLEMAREHVPDLIVSDVMMPEMDGQSLCEAVKGDADIDFIPVILLTAKASRDSRLAGLAGGADDYLTKPVDLAELLVRADNLITSRRRVRERLRATNQQLPSVSMAMKEPPRDASGRALLESLSAVMADHLADEEFNVDGMASALGMGRSTLYRKLEPLLGMSPMDALWEYRLVQSAQWLSETSITVSEVAYGVGFKSVPHFCGRFRDRYGETPSAYRRARANSVR